MEEFTIYYGTPEGKDIKIGVDSSYPARIKKQKIMDAQILEVHTCVYEVSRREQELQRQYGVAVDKTPYYVTYFKNKNDGQRTKISETLQGHQHTEETKRKLSEANLGNTHATGTKHSEEAKAKMSAAQTGKIRSEETRQKISLTSRTTTPEFDALVIQDIKAGMSQHKTAAKYNTTRGIVCRIIRNMNE